MIPFPDDARAPALQASAVIPVTLGSETRDLPVLSIRANRPWTEKWREAMGEALLRVGRTGDFDGAMGELTATVDVMLDLLLDYDLSGVLGGREWLEEHATDAQIQAIYRQVTVAAFPTVELLSELVPQFRTILTQLLADQMSSTTTSSSRRSTAGGRRKSKRT